MLGSPASGSGKGAAFFDLDRTLMEGSSAIHFGRAVYKAGQATRRQLARDLWANLKFRLEGSTDEGTEALRDRILEGIAGVRVVDLMRLGPSIMSTLLPRVYPEMLRTAYAHQDAGRPAFIVTAASQEMAESLAYVLRFDGGIGTRSEVVDGVYTGRPEGPLCYREGKAAEIRRVAEEHDLDLAESYAYSDSGSDLPMLQAVGHPVAVNPDTELAQIAREETWQIMRFDKLGRRLRIASAAAALGLIGWAGGYLAARLRPQRRRLRLLG
jgi:HAD superfamily hydrolase (TIGR01490 family)